MIAGKIYLLSDGAGIRLPDTFGDSAELLQFIKIGSSDHSVGITRLSIQPDPKLPRTYQVFVGLKNAWPIEKKVGVLLAYGTRDNFLPDQAHLVTLPPNDGAPTSGQGGAVFEKVVADPGKLFVRLDDTDDDFPLDNTAYGVLAPPAKVRVLLVTRGNQILEHFIQTAVNVGGIEGQIIAPEAYSPALPADLYILDGFAPPADKLPRVDTLLIRPQVSTAGDVAGFKVGFRIDNPPILQWRREDPVMQAVELSELRVSSALLMDRDPSAIGLVNSLEAPLVAYKDFGAARRYLVSFSPLLESNWWQHPSLLIFLQNICEQTRLRHYIGVPQLITAGSPARLWEGDADGSGAVRVTLPDGAIEKMQAKDGAVDFAQTDKVGFYEVASGARKSLFAVNLLSASESGIRPRSLQTSGGARVGEATSVAMVNQEIWRWIALSALAVLMLEWWVYHRRIG